MVTIIIPKQMSQKGDLVVIPKKDLDALIERAEASVGEKDILRWSREAKQLKRAGKLQILRKSR